MFELQQRMKHCIIQKGKVPDENSFQFSKEENIAVWTNFDWILFVTQIVPFIDFRNWPRELFVQIAEAYGCTWNEEFFLHLLRHYIILKNGTRGHRAFLKRTRHSFPLFCKVVKSKQLGVNGKQLFLQKFRYFLQSNVKKTLIPVGTYSYAVRHKNRKRKSLSYEEGMRRFRFKRKRRNPFRFSTRSEVSTYGSRVFYYYDGKMHPKNLRLQNLQVLRRRRIIEKTREIHWAHEGCSEENCDQRVHEYSWFIAKGSQQCCICGGYSETVHLCEQHCNRYPLMALKLEHKMYCECHECWSQLQKHRISFTTADCKKSVNNVAWSKTTPKQLTPDDIHDVQRSWKPQGKCLSQHVNKKWLNRHISSMTDSLERRGWRRKRKKKRRKQLKEKVRSKGLYLK